MKAKHFKSRHALLMSLTSLMLCVSMLFGATFAWFTDSVTSGVNRIISGNLDVEITHQTAGGTAEPVSSTTKLFTKDMNGKDLLWEPEVMAYETFTVSNKGTLNLKYQMNVNKVGENNLNNHVLADVIRVAVVDGNTVTRDASLFANAPTLAAFVQNPVSLANFTNATGSINAGAAAQSFTIMLYWPEDGSTYALAGQNDNDYNVNNTSVASDSLKYLWVNLGITLVATQETGEYDSFTNTYDQSANTTDVEDKWAGVAVASAVPTLTATTGEGGVITTTATSTVAAAPTTDTSKQTTVTLTAVSNDSSAAFDQSSKLNLKVETNDVKASSSSTAFTVTDTGSTAVASIDLTLTKITTTNGVESDPVPLTSGFTSLVDTYVAAGLNNPKVKYDGAANLAFGASNAGTSVNAQSEVDTVGEYWYEPGTGHLVFMTDHYSQYYVTTQDVAYIAATDTAYQTLEAAFGAAADGNTITLLRDSAGNGIIAPQDMFSTSGLTVDFSGHTYTVDGSTLAGSNGTKTQAFQLLKGNKITFKNGAVIGNQINVKMLIQNYSNLTLDGMTLDATKGNNSVGYVLSTNNGSTMIKNTTITAKSTGVAFDVDSGWGNYESNEVTVEGNSVINGNVEVAFENKTQGTPSKLTVTGGTFNGEIVKGNGFDSCTVSITGGTFSTDVKDYCAEGYTAVPNSGSKPTSWTVLSTAEALAAKAKAAGATSITESSTGMRGTMSDGVVYEWRADGSVYVADATNFAGETYTVPEFVTGLGDSSFKNNTTIKTLKITGNITSAKKALQENSTITTVDFGSKMTSIPDRMFYGCTGITSLTLPANITRIEDWAFYGNTALQSLTALGQIEYIGYKAFDSCSALKTLDIQGSPNIMGWAGRGASAIETIIIRGENATVNLNYAPVGQTKGSYVFCREQSGNNGKNAGVTFYVANQTVADRFACDINLGATCKIGEFPN